MKVKEKIPTIQDENTCYHCGDLCKNDDIVINNHHFCCDGCKTVFEILEKADLGNYYQMNQAPGISGQRQKNQRYEYLDDQSIIDKIIQFTDGVQTTIIFSLPKIHCSSCIWLLENLFRLHEGILKVHVNFLRREATVSFLNEKISLRQTAELLYSLGYPPDLNLDNINKTEQTNTLRPYYYKLSVAFFCFGNIMLLSFPEYLGLDILAETSFRKYFGYLNFVLALPVLLYSAQEFFQSAIGALRQKMVNMDFPIVLGILIMFLRSSWEIFSGTGAGYMDTLASLVFLMLIGRMFQQKVYHRLSFDRDYKSYFPVSVTAIKDDKEISTPVAKLQPGDRIIIHNQELIPADSILFKGNADIDYSFVTGESIPVNKTLGEIIYAGGKQVGNAIELEVIKEVSQSYLTQLWNDKSYDKKYKENILTLSNKVSKSFTYIVVAIALGAALYWLRTDSSKALNAFTAVLIITCPCALALSSPFTLGNAIRILGKKKFYLKNGPVTEKLANADTIVFDKTGTITQANDAAISYTGNELTIQELQLIKSLARQLNHPLSQKIYDSIPKTDLLPVDTFIEYPGKGAEGLINGISVKAGTAKMFPDENLLKNNQSGTNIFISVNNNVKGYFSIHNKYREGLVNLVNQLKRDYKLIVLSGDNDSEKEYLNTIFKETSKLFFYQTPSDKLTVITELQNKGHNVLMIGDGLNDAGALKQSNVGISISDDLNNFSPACDGILDSTEFSRLHEMLRYAKSCMNIVKASFVLSFIYNIAGIYFAVQGTLSPLIAAILMPLSSVTIILFTTIASNISAQKELL